MNINIDNIQKTPVEVSAMMRQLEGYLRTIAKPGVMVNCVLGANTYYIETDPGVATAVMRVLIDNAAKFTDKGSITFGYDVNDDELYFYIKDTGIGIPRESQPEIFEATADNANTSLIQAKRAIEALDGDIGVESRGMGKGSTFWYTIPGTEIEILPPQNLEAQVQDPINTSYPASANAPQLSKDKITLLIAEDNESNFLLFKSVLESRYNIIHARDGQEAIDKYKAYADSINLILMDINMPIKDGYETTREIRELSKTVPIVAVTAYAFTSDKQRIFQNGFNAYVSKPISINRLERIINDLVEH